MKKFLSICLVALCSISAMYAQTADVKTHPNEVDCGSTVKVSATAEDHFKFDHWEIKNDANGNSIANNITPNNTNNPGYVTSCQTTTTNGKETNELTVTLNGSLIDRVSTTPGVTGTLTFEAFFTEKNWYIINAEVDDVKSTGSGSVSPIPNDGKVYEGETITLTANADDCSVFVRWEDENGQTVPGISDDEPNKLSVSPDLTNWQANSTTPHTYKAVFAKKTVNIKVKTADNTQGKVAIVSVTAPAANPQQ